MTLHIPEITADMSTLEAALEYAKAGWYVLPVDLDVDGKHPGSVVGKGWPSKSSRDPKQLAAWFAGTNYGIALHCGRSGATSFDVDEFNKVPDVLKAHLNDGPHQSSRPDDPGRGHYPFLQPPGRMIGNSCGRLGGAWGEVRGTNGVIIAAPTPHSAGGEYRWLRTGPIPVLPNEIAERLPDGSSAEDAVTDAEIQAFLEEHQGDERPEVIHGLRAAWNKHMQDGDARHPSMVSVLTGAMKEARAGYFPASAAEHMLRELFIEAKTRAPINGEKQLTAKAAHHAFAGILAWAVGQANAADLDQVRARVNEKMPDGVEEVDNLGNARPKAAPFNDTEFWQANTTLTTIYDYALSCMVSPWGLLGVLIIYMLDAAPYSVALPGIADDDSPGSLNLFTGIVDPSGSGKGRLERVGERYLQRCEVSLPPGSGEGIPKMFGRRPTSDELKAKPGDDNWVEIIQVGTDNLVFKRRNIVITAPEVDTLAALTGRSGATLFETLRRAFSGETLGFGYADDSKRIVIPAHQYRLGLIVGIQPERSGVLLDDTASAGGTPQRLLWVPASDKRIRMAGRPTKPEPGRPYRGPWPSRVKVCDTARTAIMAGVEARAQGDGDALDGHLMFVRLKVAAALGFLDGRCEVTDQDWQLAETVVDMSNRQRQRCVDALADSAAKENERRGRSEGMRAVISTEVQQNHEAQQLDRTTELIVAKVIEAGPLKPWKLKQLLNSRYRSLFDAALDSAISQGRLAVREGEVTTPC